TLSPYTTLFRSLLKDIQQYQKTRLLIQLLRQHLLITVKLLIKRCLLVLVQLGIHDPSFLIGRVASKRLFVNQLENRMFLLKKATHIIQNKSTLLRHAFVISCSNEKLKGSSFSTTEMDL